MGTYRNRWGIEIRICCASCQYKEYDKKTGERICTLTQRQVERQELCEEWHLSQGLEMAGSGGGEVKSKEYLREKFLECIISTKEKEMKNENNSKSDSTTDGDGGALAGGLQG